MGSKLANGRGKDLYQFWGTKISEELNKALKNQHQLINLASNESKGIHQYDVKKMMAECHGQFIHPQSKTLFIFGG